MEGSNDPINNFKGVMLCNRPQYFSMPGAQRKALAQRKKNRRHRKPANSGPFVSTSCNTEPIGVTPIPKELTLQQQRIRVISKEENITWQHKVWLTKQQKSNAGQAEELLSEEARRQKRKEAFQRKEKQIRDAIKAYKEAQGDNELDENTVAALYSGAPLPSTSSIAAGEASRAVAVGSSDGHDERQLVGAAAAAKPAWARTSVEAEDAEDHEVGELLEFTKALDFDGFVKDMEVVDALRFVRQKVQEKEAVEAAEAKARALEAARYEYVEEDVPDLDENGEPTGTTTRVVRRVEVRRAEHDKAWDASVKVVERDDAAPVSSSSDEKAAVSDMASEVLKGVHSKASMAAVMKQVQKAPPTHTKQYSAEDLAEMLSGGPYVSRVDPVALDGGDGGDPSFRPRKPRPDGTDVNNLPFLYRNPAI